MDRFHKIYAIEPKIWYQFLSFEIANVNVSSVVCVNRMIELFKLAFQDHYSIDFACLLASLASYSNLFNDEQAREIWRIILPAFGYEFSKGQLIWKAWRDDTCRRQPETGEKYVEIAEKIMQELRIPLANMQDTYQEILAFFVSHSRMYPNFDRNETDEVFIATLQKVEAVLPYENQLNLQISEMSHQERFEMFINYITNSVNVLSDKGLQVLHERMVESCRRNVFAWELYLQQIYNRAEIWTPNEHPSSLVFHQTLDDIITRAMRNNQTPPILTEILLMKMNLMESELPRVEAKEQIRELFQNTWEVGFCSQQHIVTISLAYCSYLLRITNFDNDGEVHYLRGIFQCSWKRCCVRYGRSADGEQLILSHWENVERSKLNTPDRRREFLEMITSCESQQGELLEDDDE